MVFTDSNTFQILYPSVYIYLRAAAADVYSKILTCRTTLVPSNIVVVDF